MEELRDARQKGASVQEIEKALVRTLQWLKPQTKIIKTDISYFTTDELLQEIYRRASS